MLCGEEPPQRARKMKRQSVLQRLRYRLQAESRQERQTAPYELFRGEAERVDLADEEIWFV